MKPKTIYDILMEPHSIKVPKGWEDSQYNWLRVQPIKVKGTIIENAVREDFRGAGLTVESPKSSSHDLIVDGRLTEVKLSMASDTFIFNQIRDQAYDQIVLVGISPYRIYMYLARQPNIDTYMKFKPQHGGKKGKSGTYLYHHEVGGMCPSWLIGDKREDVIEYLGGNIDDEGCYM